MWTELAPSSRSALTHCKIYGDTWTESRIISKSIGVAKPAGRLREEFAGQNSPLLQREHESQIRSHRASSFGSIYSSTYRSPADAWIQCNEIVYGDIISSHIPAALIPSYARDILSLRTRLFSKSSNKSWATLAGALNSSSKRVCQGIRVRFRKFPWLVCNVDEYLTKVLRLVMYIHTL